MDVNAQELLEKLENLKWYEPMGRSWDEAIDAAIYQVKYMMEKQDELYDQLYQELKAKGETFEEI